MSDLAQKAQQYFIDIQHMPTPFISAIGDGVADDTNAIQSALDLAYKSYTDNGNPKYVLFPQGSYKITHTLTSSPIVHWVFKGLVNINDYIADTTDAIYIIQKSTDPQFGRGNYLSPTFNNSSGILQLISYRATQHTGIGIHISSITSKTNNFRANNITVNNYAKGIQIDSVNFYLSFLENLIIEANTVGLQIGDDSGTNINSGENINISNCLFSLNNCAVKITNDNPVKFFKCSFDVNYCVLYLTTNNRGIIFDGCWIEATGYNTSSLTNGMYNGFCGIVSAFNSPNWYDKTFTTLRDTRIVSPQVGIYQQQNLFVGTTLCLTLDNLLLDYSPNFWAQITKGMIIAFIVSDNIRKLKIINTMFSVSSAPWIQSKLSVIEPYFVNDTVTIFPETSNTVTLPMSTLDYDVIGSEGLSKCEIVTVDEMKCLGLITNYAGGVSNLTLRSKRKYPIKGLNFGALVFIKGYTNGANSNAEISAEFYDSNDILISTLNIQSTFRNIELTPTDTTSWIFPYKNSSNNIDIPKGAMYYKINVLLYCNSGSSNIAEVYFTGLHVFNY